MVQTPGFMILRRDIKPHNMGLASNKTVFYNDRQIHLKKHSALRLCNTLSFFFFFCFFFFVCFFVCFFAFYSNKINVVI